MPVKLWEVDDRRLSSRIVTSWDTEWTAEEYRPEAEELDKTLDAVLDDALQRVSKQQVNATPKEFLRAWAVGRALQESGVLQLPALNNERRQLLWRALAYKCRTGARYTREREAQWQSLRPQSAKEPRREGGTLDYFEMCYWLADQDLDDAVMLFGGHIRNVWQMLERPTLRPISLRRALLKWFQSLPRKVLEELEEPRAFANVMKELRQRWPDRGPGSAKRPIHYSEDALQEEIAGVLEPLMIGLQYAGRSKNKDAEISIT
jgi:hypothetical protein